MSYSKFPSILGEFEMVTVVPPSAGNGWTYVPDANIIIRPLGIAFTLQTDATGVNRIIRVPYVIGGNVLIAGVDTVAHAINTTITYNCSQGAYDPAPIDDYHSIHLAPAYLTSSDAIFGNITNVGVGDLFTNIQIAFLKWRQ